MQLASNPIVISGMRLSRRGHLVAAVIVASIAALLLLMDIDELFDVSGERRRRMGLSILSLSLVLQSLILIVGGAISTARTVQRERQNGLLEANRLTPMSPNDLLLGYWLGPQATSVAASIPLAVAGLVATIISRVPFSVWIVGQALLASTALFGSLLAALFTANAPTKRASGGIVGALGLGALWSSSMGPVLVSNVLLPTWPLLMVIRLVGDQPEDPVSLAVPWVLTAIGLQGGLGAIAWIAARRAIAADPTLRFDGRWLVVAAWAVIIGGQVFIGILDTGDATRHGMDAEGRAMLVYVMGGLLGAVGLGISNPVLQDVRRRALRAGAVTSAWVMRGGSLPVAIGFGAMLTGALAVLDPAHGVALAGLDATLAFVFVAAVLELATMRFGVRAVGVFVVVGVLFVVAPMVVAAVNRIEEFVFVIPGSFGLLALVQPSGTGLDEGRIGFVSHIVFTTLVGFAWFRGVHAWTASVNREARDGQGLPTS